MTPGEEPGTRHAAEIALPPRELSEATRTPAPNAAAAEEPLSAAMPEIRPIDISRSDITSNRRVLGWPSTMVRRLVLRILRPFTAQVTQQASANDAALQDAIRHLEARIEQLKGSTAADMASVRFGLSDAAARTGTLEMRVADLSVRADTVQERLSPTLFASDTLAVVEIDGRRTIGYGDAPSRRTTPYAHFEETFRGSPERVRELLSTYVGAFAHCEHVFDAGCGRGEFISLLREHDIRASGADIDAGMLAVARAADLDVHAGDARTFLESNPGVFDGLFSSQFVEHLGFSDLAAFLETAHASLRPGSVVVLETVNPYAPWGLQAYRCDPTHKTLLFPEVLLVLLQGAGFINAHVTFPNEFKEYDAARRVMPTYAVMTQTPTRD